MSSRVAFATALALATALFYAISNVLELLEESGIRGADAGGVGDRRLAFGEKGLKNAMKSANRSGARFAVIAGERDLTEGVVQLKDLESGEQTPIALDTVVAELQAKLA